MTLVHGRLLVTASIVHSSSETSVLTRAARRNITEGTILHILIWLSHAYAHVPTASFGSFSYKNFVCICGLTHACYCPHRFILHLSFVIIIRVSFSSGHPTLRICYHSPRHFISKYSPQWTLSRGYIFPWFTRFWNTISSLMENHKILFKNVVSWHVAPWRCVDLVKDDVS
jgi:hypothetical protein